jgi:NADH dehydrogenase FAD-containing subunit
MSKRRRSKRLHVVVGAGATGLSNMTLDLADAEEAAAVARRLAEQTGRTVTVRDEKGRILTTIPGAAKH